MNLQHIYLEVVKAENMTNMKQINHNFAFFGFFAI